MRFPDLIPDVTFAVSFNELELALRSGSGSADAGLRTRYVFWM